MGVGGGGCNGGGRDGECGMEERRNGRGDGECGMEERRNGGRDGECGMEERRNGGGGMESVVCYQTVRYGER